MGHQKKTLVGPCDACLREWAHRISTAVAVPSEQICARTTFDGASHHISLHDNISLRSMECTRDSAPGACTVAVATQNMAHTVSVATQTTAEVKMHGRPKRMRNEEWSHLNIN